MKSTDKVTTRLFAVMDKNYTYEYYAKNTVKKGERLRIRTTGGAYGHQLINEGIVLILGHGASEVIPKSHFHLEEEVTTQITTSVTETRRVS